MQEALLVNQHARGAKTSSVAKASSSQWLAGWRVALGFVVAAVASPLAAQSDSIIETFAGGSIGDGGAATQATFVPSGVAVDGAGNLYITDGYEDRIRKVNAATGIISTVAGSGTIGFSGDGAAATSARFGDLEGGVVVDSAGNLYIADTYNHRIRKVDATTGIISTIAGSGRRGGFRGDGRTATLAMLNIPRGVAVDGAGNLYIADTYNHRIRKVDAATGIISTIAGSGATSRGGGGFGGDGGAATSAQLHYPYGVAVDGAGNLYIADHINHRIRKVDAATGIISTVAGSGATGNYVGGFGGDGSPAISAMLNSPRGVAVDGAGNLYIVDSGNHRIRRVDAATGIISTVAGTRTNGFSGDSGPATSAQLNNPAGVAVDGTGNLYIADLDNNRIRRVDAATGTISTFAGSGRRGFSGDGGPATSAQLNNPAGVAVDGTGNLYIADLDNNRIRRVDAATGTISTFAGSGRRGFSGDGGPAISAMLNSPRGVAVDGAGNLYIADQGNYRIRKVDAATGVISTAAGTWTSGFRGDGGAATSAWLTIPKGVAVDRADNLYIADYGDHRIRKVDAATGIISTFAGSGRGGFSGDGAPATSAMLSNPIGVAVDRADNLYIADYRGHRIHKVDAATGIISTFAGSGLNGFGGDGGAATSAWISFSTGVAVDGAGNIYIADNNNHRIRKVDAATGIISTIAGSGQRGFNYDGFGSNGGFDGDGGAATSARLNYPSGVAVDGTGNLYIADSGNNRIRRIRNGAAPRPPNSPPVTIRALEGAALDLGERLEVPLLDKFRDPEGGDLIYSVESSDLLVVRVRIENGTLIAEAVGEGVATLTITATDEDGLSATLRFAVQSERTARSRWKGWHLILLEPQAASAP